MNLITTRFFRPVAWFAFAALLLTFRQLAAQETESYPVHPDTLAHDGVPRGVVSEHRFADSHVYPGTEREYFVYVPSQYVPGRPAALMVFQDGEKYIREKSGYRIHHVFDNLIHRGEMPVTIAICVNPGVVPGADDAQSRFNRSFEYDTVSDRYASFLIDELIPRVKKSYSITDDPNLCGIAGSSSGAIAAFGVAWHRSDRFRRVFSTVGTYVGLRGGNEYPTLIRKHEPKPIRIFLQDGRNDLNIYGGSWFHANQNMLSALQWAGYQVRHAWGDGGHNGKHGAAIFPDAMRWLWSDFGDPITADASQHPEVTERFFPDMSWELISQGHQAADSLALAPTGDIYFIDGPSDEIWKIPAGGSPAEVFADDVPGASALAFDPSGHLYCARRKTQTITKISPDGRRTDLMSGVSCDHLVVIDKGIYFTGPNEAAVWYLPIENNGASASSDRPIKAADGPRRPGGLTVTPDKQFLLVVDSAGRYVWSYKIDHDTGRLVHGQEYGYMHSLQDQMTADADGITMTNDGFWLVTTESGIQIFDPPGRVHLILSRPDRSGRLTSCVFAGEKSDTLFITAGNKIFARKTKMQGIAPWETAIVPRKPKL